MQHLGKAPPVGRVQERPLDRKVQAADVVLIAGPDAMEAHKVADFQEVCKRAGVDFEIIDGGEREIDQATIKQLRKSGRLGPSTHVFLCGHGRIGKKTRDGIVGKTKSDDGASHLFMGAPGVRRWRTVDLISALLKPIDDRPAREERPLRSGTIHVLSCQAGFLKTELTPNHKIWGETAYVLHSSTKASLSGPNVASMNAVIELLGEFKAKKLGIPGPERVLDHILAISGECVTLLGGALTAQRTEHAPKNVRDVRRVYEKALEAKAKARLSDLQKRFKEKTTVETGANAKQLPDANDAIFDEIDAIHNLFCGRDEFHPFEEKLCGALHVRINRKDWQSAKAMLDDYPDLANAAFMKSVTPLQISSFRGGVEMVEALLSHGAKLESRDRFGNTALIYGCVGGNSEITSKLLDLGANPNSKGKLGRTPIFVACEMDDVGSVEVLLQARADANLANDDGLTPLHISSAKGHSECVKFLLACKGIDCNRRDKDGRVPLHYASGRADIARLLLKSGAKPNALDKNGVAPLTQACGAGDEVFVQLLIHAGAEVNLADSNGDTALHAVGLIGNVNVAKILLNAGANPNLPNRQGFTPLILTCDRGDVACARLLLNSGADVNSRTDKGVTALMAACNQSNEACVKLLLASKEIKVDLADESGNTALHHASMKNFLAGVERLSTRSDATTVKNVDGMTPFDLGSPEVKALIERSGTRRRRRRPPPA